MYTLDGSILWCVNYIAIKIYKKKGDAPKKKKITRRKKKKKQPELFTILIRVSTNKITFPKYEGLCSQPF